MDTLWRQIGRARRRLDLQVFLGRLGRCWFVTQVIAALAIGVAKKWNLGVEPRDWAWSWLGGSMAAGLVAALAWTVWRRESALAAAMEIDRRFGLKERVSSSLALSAGELETEAGRALVSDTAARIAKLDVGSAFAVRPDRWALLPLLPLAISVLLVVLVSDSESSSTIAATTGAQPAEQVRKSAQALEKKLEQRRHEAQKQGLEDASELFKRLEQDTKNLADKGDLDHKQALVKLNDLAKDMQKRREKLLGEEMLKQQLNQLKNLHKGPADKVADALKNGDFKQAAKEVEKLKQQLANNQLGEKQKQELAKQIDQVREAIEKQAQARQVARQDLERQLEQARQDGRTDDAQKAQQQLDKLNQQSQKAGQASAMAEKLAQAAKALEQGEAKQAQAALDKISDQLKQMQQAGEEMAMLDQALEELAETKSSMSCKNCQGEGCEQCRGEKQGAGQGREKGNEPGQAMGRGGHNLNKPGSGIGTQRGQWGRGDPKDDGKFYDSNVRQQVGKGSATVSDQVDGPNRKGDVREEIKTALETSKHEASDPLTGQRLPREYRDHAKTYFDAIREGQK